MDLSNKEINEIIKRIEIVRTHLMNTQPFFSVLLMHSKFALDEETDTAYTDGEYICFSPKFVKKLNDQELEFILIHEVMHIVLDHCKRKVDSWDQYLFNVAADIVVNSNILYSYKMDKSKITIREYGESMHLAPNKKEGYNYTLEQVYEMISGGKKSNAKDSKNNKNNLNNSSFDDHSFWPNDGGDNEEWKQILVEAKKISDLVKQAREKDSGNIPKLLEREINELINPQLDWREILQDFICEETNDYSFNPPDRRMQWNPLLLPDFNEKEESVSNIWFVIDTSGSVRQEELTACISEIVSAFEQFDNKISGIVSYFDSEITEPSPFHSLEDFKKVKIVGGGGTSFEEIFSYMKKNMMDNLPSSIIILTDGYASFPNEKDALGVPVLWVIDNKEVEVPWGKVARIEVDE